MRTTLPRRKRKALRLALEAQQQAWLDELDQLTDQAVRRTELADRRE